MKLRIPHKMTNRQQAALKREADRQLMEHERMWMVNIEALMLYTLHKSFGFGKKRLLRFRECLLKEYYTVRDRYMCEEFDVFPMIHILKDLGLDLDEANEPYLKDKGEN